MRVSLNFTLGTLVGSARIGMKLSQRQVAERMSVSPSYIHDIENEKRTPSDPVLIERFSKVLHIDLDVLCFAVGILPPDLPDTASPERIKAAFAAMREALGS